MQNTNAKVLVGWVLALNLLACGGGSGGGDSATTPIATATPTPAPTPTPVPTPAPEPVPVPTPIPTPAPALTKSFVYVTSPQAFSIGTSTFGGVPVPVPGAKCSFGSIDHIAVNDLGRLAAHGYISFFFGGTSPAPVHILCGSITSSGSTVLSNSAEFGTLVFASNGRLLLSISSHAAEFDPILPGPPAEFPAKVLERIFGVAKDGTSYSSDGYFIRKTTAAGITSILAGAPRDPLATAPMDGLGSSARFAGISSIALNAGGDVFVLDSFAIRKVSPAGLVTTIAGKLGEAGAMDGFGTASRFGNTASNRIVSNSSGNLYVTDTDNHAVRKITPNGDVSTIAGKLGVPGHVLGALPGLLMSPGALAIDAANALYVVVKTGNNASDPVEILKIE